MEPFEDVGGVLERQNSAIDGESGRRLDPRRERDRDAGLDREIPAELLRRAGDDVAQLGIS